MGGRRPFAWKGDDARANANGHSAAADLGARADGEPTQALDAASGALPPRDPASQASDATPTEQLDLSPLRDEESVAHGPSATPAGSTQVLPPMPTEVLDAPDAFEHRSYEDAQRRASARTGLGVDAPAAGAPASTGTPAPGYGAPPSRGVPGADYGAAPGPAPVPGAPGFAARPAAMRRGAHPLTRIGAIVLAALPAALLVLWKAVWLGGAELVPVTVPSGAIGTTLDIVVTAGLLGLALLTIGFSGAGVAFSGIIMMLSAAVVAWIGPVQALAGLGQEAAGSLAAFLVVTGIGGVAAGIGAHFARVAGHRAAERSILGR